MRALYYGLRAARVCFLVALFVLTLFSTANAQFPETRRFPKGSIWDFLDLGKDDAEIPSQEQDVLFRAQSSDESNLLFSSDWGVSEEDDAEDSSARSYERALADSYGEEKVGSSTLYVPVRDASFSDIIVSSQYGWKGEPDEFGDVYVLYGDCRVECGGDRVSAPVAVVWLSQPVDEYGNKELGSKVYVYLEKDSTSTYQIDLARDGVLAKTNGNAWLGEFHSRSEVDLRIATPGESQIRPDEAYFRALCLLQDERARESVDANISREPQSQELPTAPSLIDTFDSTLSSESSGDLTQPTREVVGATPGWTNLGDGEKIVVVPETTNAREMNFGSSQRDVANARRYRFVDRYETHHSIKQGDSYGDGKRSWIVSNGFTLIVQGVDIQNVAVGEALELSADSAVIWSRGLDIERLDETQANDLDFEIYLDGNVVFREGNSVVYAKKMYYDVKNRVGIIENAEMIAEAPGMEGAFFRIGANRIVQSSPDSFRAEDAWISTSLMGKPTYRLQSNSIVAERRSRPLYDATTGDVAIDPQTGRRLSEEQQYIIAENNFVTLGALPIFYWPWAAMDARDRSFYLKSFKLGHDSVLGSQVRTGWDLYQLLQIKERPSGTDWSLDLDYLSKRGLGHGSTFRYERDSLWNWNSRAVGLVNYYGINDKGSDNLGRDRRDVSFPHKYRYRGIWKHRQEFDFNCDTFSWLSDCPLSSGWTFTGQVGKSSDRNFIPQYFEDEWNSSSNPETRFELRRTVNNRSLGLNVAVRTDSFYTQTNWLPKLDHYLVGQSLCDSPFVWYEHTKIGFAQFKTTDSPYDAVDRANFRYLDWELLPSATSNAPGEIGETRLSGDSLVFTSRHEIDAPFQLGPVKTTPYALGEYGFWGHGTEGTNISRLYGRLGVRFNLPVWKVDSDVENKVWYVNGIAHKMNFVVDASYSDANKDYQRLILYDQIDDWQVQDYRRRYSASTFSGLGPAGLDAIPVRFDERYYAIRQGVLAGNVTSPSSELADDLQLVRLGWNNRWQTKRGPNGYQRVVDWITFDAGISFYPKKSENFGKVPGMIDYEARWQVGDRFAVLSSGLYDVWGTGQKITRIGVQRQRPSLSSCYLGIDRLYGPIDSTYLNFGLTYRTSEKWGLGFSNSYDLSEGYNIGQKLSISRIGESFVVTLGASRNESKNTWGVNLSVEPVFLFDKGKREEGLLGLGNM